MNTATLTSLFDFGWRLDYLPRLLGVTLAAGISGYAAGSLLSLLLAPAALRRLQRQGSLLGRAGESARWLLALRLLPLSFGLLLALGLCLPSYLWFEPWVGYEHVSWLLCLAAIAGASLLTVALRRARRALRGLDSFVRGCRRSHHPAGARHGSDLLLSPHRSPVLSLAGLIRPQLLVSQSLLDRLAPDQLDVSLRHELAHRRAHDNWKRLLLVLSPALCAKPLMDRLEDAWARLTEWSADDAAVLDEPAAAPQRSLALASALVAVARLGAPADIPLASYLNRPVAASAHGNELEQRVQRLLTASSAAIVPRRLPRLQAAAAWIGLASALTLMLQPATLQAVHQILERLIH